MTDQERKDAALAALLYQAVGGDIASGKVGMTDEAVEQAAYEVEITGFEGGFNLSLKQKEADSA